MTPAGLSAVTFLLGAGELVATFSVARFTDMWGKRRSVAVGAALMVPASAGSGVVASPPGPRRRLLAIGVLGFEFSVVSAISLGTGLVPGSPARGLGLLIGVDTVGRAVMSVPATRLYTSHGIGWPAAIATVFAAVAVVTIMLSALDATAARPSASDLRIVRDETSPPDQPTRGTIPASPRVFPRAQAFGMTGLRIASRRIPAHKLGGAGQPR